MTAAETADMQRLLDEMKKEDAESAEQSARRDAEQVARARAIEQEQKRKAEENQRKAAEKKARQRIMAKERREAEAAAKSVSVQVSDPFHPPVQMRIVLTRWLLFVRATCFAFCAQTVQGRGSAAAGRD
jgi:hypothetical protein